MEGAMIVTGGGRGIGAAIGRLAARRGYAVAVNYSRAKERAETLAAEIRAGGGRALPIAADVGDEAQVVALFEEVDRELGPVTALVNNAATDYTVRVADLELPRFERTFDVNVRGPFLCAREAIRRMSTDRGGRGGTIVNIGSISARYGGLPEDVVYTATKGALDAFTMGLAREVAKEGIRVCCVRPGLTQTEIFDTNLGLEQVMELARKSVPLGRIGQPEEVANLVLWLCSDEASYVTASIYDVCGGR